MRIQPIILAAGKGTRMGNPDLPKVLFPINGTPMVQYVLDAFSHTSFLPPVLVVGYHHQLVRDALGDKFRYVLQEEQKGTGHAIMMCREELAGTADAYFIVCGDQPLLSSDSMAEIAANHVNTQATFSMGTVVSDYESFEAFGRILRSPEGDLIGIREYKDCTPEEKEINEYNPSLYCCNDNWLWNALDLIKPLNNQGEYYITDLVGIAIDQKQPTSSLKIKDWHEALGVNTPDQLEEVTRCLLEKQ